MPIAMAMLRKRSGVVNITARTVSASDARVFPGTATATASYGLLNTGVLQLNGAGGVGGEWMGSGTPADYDVRFTSVSGTVPSGVAYATWLNLGTSRVPSLTATRSGSVGVTTVTGVITVEIRATGSGVVLDTENITLTAEAELTV